MPERPAAWRSQASRPEQAGGEQYHIRQVVAALVQAADVLQVRYHLGVSASTAAFYTGQGRPGWQGLTQS